MADFNDILEKINESILNMNKRIPSIQKDIYDSLQEDLRNLDLQNGKIKATVKNLSLINSIKNKLNKLIVTPEYKEQVKDFAKSFNEIAALQNDYWRGIEKQFKPKPLLQAIKEQAISDTISKLTEAGIGANIAEPIADILRTNITTGGSYKDLAEQLRENLVNTETPGTMEKYIGQITTDAVNQYSNQYTQVVSSDLGYEWYKYDNTDILTTRPFCDALTDRPYFHISEVPALLRGEGLTYLNKKTGKRVPVPIYDKTGLPSGMIPGTDASNFFIRRGGYRCGHSIRPINESQVPQADKDRVFITTAYKNWATQNGIPIQEPKKAHVDVRSEVPSPNEIQKTEKQTERKSDYDLDVLMNDDTEQFAFYMKDGEKINGIKKIYPKMNSEEIVSIDLFGNQIYKRTNKFLRNEADYRKSAESDSYTKQFVRFQDNYVTLLNKALDKLPNYEATVYRGGNFSEESINQYKNAFKRGESITELGFTSTSKYAGTALEGDTFFVIKSKTGKDVEKIMEFGHEGPTEGEVTFKSGTNFNITDIRVEKTDNPFSKTGKRTLIKMEEI